MIRIYPSLIAADILNLNFEIQQLTPHIDGFHIDIMDNHFVPNLTWGSDMINAIARITDKQIWIHLMVTDPLSIIKRCSLKPKSMITFHIESSSRIKETISCIIEKKQLPGIAFSPKTNPCRIKPFLHDIHHILPMSVIPGFSGQEFLSETISIIDELNAYKKEHNLDFIIVGDGGINENNIKQLYEHGVEDVAIGSAIFSHKDPVIAIEKLQYNLQ